jgi:hypothetical protein
MHTKTISNNFLFFIYTIYLDIKKYVINNKFPTVTLTFMYFITLDYYIMIFK